MNEREKVAPINRDARDVPKNDRQKTDRENAPTKAVVISERFARLNSQFALNNWGDHDWIRHGIIELVPWLARMNRLRKRLFDDFEEFGFLGGNLVVAAEDLLQRIERLLTICLSRPC